MDTQGTGKATLLIVFEKLQANGKVQENESGNEVDATFCREGKTRSSGTYNHRTVNYERCGMMFIRINS